MFIVNHSQQSTQVLGNWEADEEELMLRLLDEELMLELDELELLILDPTLAMNGKSNATFGHPAVAPSHPFTSRKSNVQRSCI